jgi:hypothetical protein
LRTTALPRPCPPFISGSSSRARSARRTRLRMRLQTFCQRLAASATPEIQRLRSTKYTSTSVRPWHRGHREHLIMLRRRNCASRGRHPSSHGNVSAAQPAASIAGLRCTARNNRRGGVRAGHRVWHRQNSLAFARGISRRCPRSVRRSRPATKKGPATLPPSPRRPRGRSVAAINGFPPRGACRSALSP